MNNLLCIKVDDEYQSLNDINFKPILSKISFCSFLLASVFLFALITSFCNMSVEELHRNDNLMKILVVLMFIFYLISSLCYIVVLVI
jgi:hypothetical protein